jgi:hypothetical protein
VGARQHLRGSNMQYLGETHLPRATTSRMGRNGGRATANGVRALGRMGQEHRRAQTPPRRLIRCSIGIIASLLEGCWRQHRGCSGGGPIGLVTLGASILPRARPVPMHPSATDTDCRGRGRGVATRLPYFPLGRGADCLVALKSRAIARFARRCLAGPPRTFRRPVEAR